MRNIHTLRYRDHTNEYFIKSRLIKLPELLKHTTLCHIKSGLHAYSPRHIPKLWTIKPTVREGLRFKGIKVAYEYPGKKIGLQN